MQRIALADSRLLRTAACMWPCGRQQGAVRVRRLHTAGNGGMYAPEWAAGCGVLLSPLPAAENGSLYALEYAGARGGSLSPLSTAGNGILFALK